MSDAKPQQAFLHEVDNRRSKIWRPVLKSKPHGIKSLNLIELRAEVDSSSSSSSSTAEPTDATYYEHPYKYELMNLKYPKFLMSDPTDIQAWMPSPEQPFEFVDDEEAFLRLVDELRLSDAKELAIDLEHHSLRSFQGFTCVMQLSTRFKDYVIDTIALRSSMSALAPFFSNPNIVKVFHGCDRDIQWMQRDFGLYVVNCFDTHQAAKLMNYKGLSLAKLLQLHCNVTLNKKHQLADWRQRPLSDEMLQYARNDTHYLLYLFDIMRKKLWYYGGCKSSENLLAALSMSRDICLGRYKKEGFNPLGFKKLLGKDDQIAAIDPIGESVLCALWDWRDATARSEDESVHFVLPSAEMLRVAATRPTTLGECQKLLSNNNNNYVSTISSSNSLAFAADIFRVVVEACRVGPDASVAVKKSRKEGGSAVSILASANASAAGAPRSCDGYDDAVFTALAVISVDSDAAEKNRKIAVAGTGKHSRAKQQVSSPCVSIIASITAATATGVQRAEVLQAIALLRPHLLTVAALGREKKKQEQEEEQNEEQSEPQQQTAAPAAVRGMSANIDEDVVLLSRPSLLSIADKFGMSKRKANKLSANSKKKNKKSKK